MSPKNIIQSLGSPQMRQKSIDFQIRSFGKRKDSFEPPWLFSCLLFGGFRNHHIAIMFDPHPVGVGWFIQK